MQLSACGRAWAQTFDVDDDRQGQGEPLLCLGMRWARIAWGVGPCFLGGVIWMHGTPVGG